MPKFEVSYKALIWVLQNYEKSVTAKQILVMATKIKHCENPFWKTQSAFNNYRWTMTTCAFASN
jgi:hypothetical protein